MPEHLRNAALRKSWALDPAIRNYVNPALEYAYDWNTPGGVPGGGELGAGMDVARMVSQIMGSGEPAAEPIDAGRRVGQCGSERSRAIARSIMRRKNRSRICRPRRSGWATKWLR